MASDKVAYLRYASITKRYRNSIDFLREVSALGAGTPMNATER